MRGVRAYAVGHRHPGRRSTSPWSPCPRPAIDDVMGSCLAKGVTALVVRQRRLRRGRARTGVLRRAARSSTAARAHGMRVVGPERLGVANTDRRGAAQRHARPGPAAAGAGSASSASPARWASRSSPRRAERGLGLSTFVSAGNRADVSGNDLLQYWQTDPATDVVLLYLETFGNPRKFARVARRLARTKPIVAVKSGAAHAPGRAGSRAHAEPIDDASVQRAVRAGRA